MKYTHKHTLVILSFAASFAAIAFTAVSDKKTPQPFKYKLPTNLIENGTIKGAPLILESEAENLVGSVVAYVHCNHCQAGVYLPHDNGDTKCTFCSRLENEN